MIQIDISKTSKVSPREAYQIYDKVTKNFENMEAAEIWLKTEYGTHTRSPMYIDGKDGQAKKVGFIIGFRNKIYESDKGAWVTYLEQHWIGFSTLEAHIF